MSTNQPPLPPDPPPSPPREGAAPPPPPLSPTPPEPPAAAERPAPPAPARAKPPAKGTGETIKETFESLVIAFVLAFAFRAYVVEPFVIPTGSMAPTLLGMHLDLTCPQCGYRFAVEVSEADVVHFYGVGNPLRGRVPWRDALRDERKAKCPMCRERIEAQGCEYQRTTVREKDGSLREVLVPTGGTTVSAGDRILVHKFIYCLSEPQRWDVVVFKAPHLQKTNINYIKRLVGLPREHLLLVEGNVYVNPELAADGQPEPGGWHIARKSATRTDAHGTLVEASHYQAWRAEKVQRAVWQPVYHSQYVPRRALPGAATLPDPRYPEPWQCPWVAAPEQAGAWELEGRTSYHYAGAGPGVIRFDFDRTAGGNAAFYAYNQASSRMEQDPVEDVRLAAAFQPEQAGLAVRLQTTARWQGSETARTPLAGVIDAAGNASLQVREGAGWRALTPALPVGAFVPGRSRQVELWYADQELSLWIDGRRVLAAGFEVPYDVLVRRRPLTGSGPGLAPQPDLQIEVAGAPVALHQVEVDRDLYYTGPQYPPYRNSPDEPYTPSSRALGGTPGLGVLRKDDRGRSEGKPVYLGPDQFFCLGDNSPNSSDSRWWMTVNPWVRARMLAESEQLVGVVPRELMMGRAFFVYFPALYRWHPEGRGWFPNLADMRFIH